VRSNQKLLPSFNPSVRAALGWNRLDSASSLSKEIAADGTVGAFLKETIYVDFDTSFATVAVAAALDRGADRIDNFFARFEVGGQVVRQARVAVLSSAADVVVAPSECLLLIKTLPKR